MTTRRILLLAFDDVQALDVVGPHQMFTGANEALGHAAYAPLIVAETPGVTASSGLKLGVDRTLNGLRWQAHDTVMALGGSDEGMRGVIRRGAMVKALQTAAGKVERVASVCAGAFLLASAGLLDGKTCATHWQAVRLLAATFPAVRVDADALYVRDGNVWTSAGVTAGIDLALAMIEADHGRALALQVARRHVVFRRRPGGQSQFASPEAGDDMSDPRLRKLARLVADRPGSDWSAPALADAAGLSVRTLTRAFAREGADSPARFVETVRLDRARAALCETSAPVAVIARSSGFSSTRALERVFVKRLGVTPTAFRERFGPRGR